MTLNHPLPAQNLHRYRKMVRQPHLGHIMVVTFRHVFVGSATFDHWFIRMEFVVDSVFIGGGGCFFSQNSLKVLLNAELLLFAVEEIMNIILSAGKIGHCCQGEMICEEAMIE
jgi:hypothetical protein